MTLPFYPCPTRAGIFFRLWTILLRILPRLPLRGTSPGLSASISFLFANLRNPQRNGDAPGRIRSERGPPRARCVVINPQLALRRGFVPHARFPSLPRPQDWLLVQGEQFLVRRLFAFTLCPFSTERDCVRGSGNGHWR